MSKFDNIFFRYFNIETFDGDEEKMENARLLFNTLMYRFEDIDEVENINEIKNEELFNEELFDDKVIEDGFREVPSEFNIPEDKYKFIDKTMKKLNLELKDLDIIPSEYDNQLEITEYWLNKKGYMMQQHYPLSLEIFSFKDEDIKKEILNKIIEEDLLLREKHFEYFDLLKSSDKKMFFNRLLEKAVDEENYEEAVIYRDSIKKLN